MNGTIRFLFLGCTAFAFGFGSVYLLYPPITGYMSDSAVHDSDRVITTRDRTEPRRYVVNLSSGTEPIEMATVQHPDALAKYQVYVNQLTISGTTWHQLRLGFFPDAQSAERIARRLREDFPLARVAPASMREWSDRRNAARVTLAAAGASTSVIAKADTKREPSNQSRSVRTAAPSAMHVALSSPARGQDVENSLQDGTPTNCDELAAHPWDPHKLTEGVYWNRVPAAKAVLACRNAVRDEPSPRNMFQYGRALAKSKEYVEAVEWYEKAADQGYVQAQYALGDVYEFGEGVTLNYVLAQSWYKKAADQGYSHAVTKLDRLKTAAITNTRQQLVAAQSDGTSTQ